MDAPSVSIKPPSVAPEVAVVDSAVAVAVVVVVDMAVAVEVVDMVVSRLSSKPLSVSVN